MRTVSIFRFVTVIVFLWTSMQQSIAQNNIRMRYFDRVIDTTREKQARIGIITYTLVQATQEDTAYFRKLLPVFRKAFLDAYPESKKAESDLEKVLLLYTFGDSDAYGFAADSLTKTMDRTNPAAACWLDYFRLYLRNIGHSEIEHPMLDSLFSATSKTARELKLDYLSALIYLSRANFMNVHETKSNFLGQKMLKYALFDTAVQFSQACMNRVLETKLLGAEARYLGLEGKFKLCQQISLRLLPMSIAFKDTSNLYVIYSMLGLINLESHNLKEAQRFAALNYELSLAIGENSRISSSCGRLMQIHAELGDTAEAKKFGLLSIWYNELAGNLHNAPLVIGNYGEVLFQLGFVDSAKYYQDIALQLRIEDGNQEGELYSYNSLADIALYKKEFVLAKQYCDKAWAIEQERSFGQYNERIFHNYYLAYSGLKNWELALSYLEKYSKEKSNSDSLNNIADIMALQSDFEAEGVKRKFERSILLEKLATDAQQKTANYTRNILLGGLIVLLMIAGAILRGFYLKRKANTLLSSKNREIEKQKEIVDSITYAKRIQYTLLAHEDLLKENLNDHFVLFKPKDIVSGDFYWATKTVSSGPEASGAVGREKFYLAVCDSTGHGVPGAFMSLLNISFLNEAITEQRIAQPDLVLNHARQRLTTSVSKDGAQDGMDGVLLCFDKSNATISYAAAYNSPVIISNGEIRELPADKMPIGQGIKQDSFTLQTVSYSSGDTLYLLTDGYADQFGGTKGKKFKYKQLYELLKTNCHLPMEEQRVVLENTIEEWRGNLEQVDDICVIGIKL